MCSQTDKFWTFEAVLLFSESPSGDDIVDSGASKTSFESILSLTDYDQQGK